MEALRKNLQFEIDRLTAALADAEARMKAEISRLRKKYQAEIAELEMTIDNLNRANIEAQKTIKKQSEQLKVCANVHISTFSFKPMYIYLIYLVGS